MMIPRSLNVIRQPTYQRYLALPKNKISSVSPCASVNDSPGQVLPTALPAKSSHERTRLRVTTIRSSLVLVSVALLKVDEPTGFVPKFTVPGVTFRTLLAAVEVDAGP